MVPYVCGYFRSLYVYKTPEIDVTRYDPSIWKVCCSLTLTYLCVFVICSWRFRNKSVTSTKAFRLFYTRILLAVTVSHVLNTVAVHCFANQNQTSNLPILFTSKNSWGVLLLADVLKIIHDWHRFSRRGKLYRNSDLEQKWWWRIHKVEFYSHI